MPETMPSEDAPRRARGRPRGWDDKTEQNTIKSLDRAMEIFEYLSTEQGKTLSQLSAELSQSPATVYRVLVTLEARGMVEFDGEAQRWYIGARAFVIGARFLRRTSLVDRARPILRSLMERTGETANLGVEKGGMVLFLNQVETHESIRAFFPPGTLSEMHASGIGKALLAYMDAARFARWIEGRQLAAFTQHTLVTPEALSAELTRTRARGYAVDAEEKNLGMRCIAAPVFDMSGEAVAGISVSGPASRMRVDATHALGEAVLAAARALTRAIGGQDFAGEAGASL
ncbi:HTH-type transcriptional regulator BhcR [Pseudaestuariivita sp.]|uniref:HTH-type transcriptional regulator BhcR n=1 Tax=Pseudaestuariivita sp. TaxID=2211669 RepID=UPI004058F739